MGIWKTVCWSSKSNYNVYVEAVDAWEARIKTSDCIDMYNKNSELFDFVYYRESPEPMLAMGEWPLNKLISVKRKISDETFEDWLNS